MKTIPITEYSTSEPIGTLTIRDDVASNMAFVAARLGIRFLLCPTVDVSHGGAVLISAIMQNEPAKCREAQESKGRMKMSKYEELKAKFEDADDYLENCGCDSCEHTRKDIRAYERAAASLIERARDELKRLCAETCKGGRVMTSSPHCVKCEAKKLLAEMEALT